MLTVDTIGKVRLALAKGESQRSVAEKYRLNRKTVSKIAESGETEFKYKPRAVKYPAIGDYIERLKDILEKEEELPVKARQTGKKIYESLQQEGYSGAYDAVRRFIKGWHEERRHCKNAYIPLQFARGEAFQFDWSRETVEVGGVVRNVEVAQVRLCHSRMPFCVAFARQEMAMLMEAHTYFPGQCNNVSELMSNASRMLRWIGSSSVTILP